MKEKNMKQANLAQVMLETGSDVNKDFNAKAKAETWTLKAKAKAWNLKAKAKAKT
jgi:hypothetical protein